jgi:hypothetical protein
MSNKEFAEYPDFCLLARLPPGDTVGVAAGNSNVGQFAFLAHDQTPDWICVCSDESVGSLERDEFVGEVYELGLPTHTDPKEIAKLLRTPCSGPKMRRR